METFEGTEEEIMRIYNKIKGIQEPTIGNIINGNAIKFPHQIWGSCYVDVNGERIIGL